MYDHFPLLIKAEVVHFKNPTVVEGLQVCDVNLSRSLQEVSFGYLYRGLRVVVETSHISQLIHCQLTEYVV